MPFKVKRPITILLIAIILIHQTGCTTLNRGENRQNHLDGFQEKLNSKSIDQNQMYDLDLCLQEALKNNLTIKSQEIQKRISALDKKVAFSYLLPRIDLQFASNSWSKNPFRQVDTDGAGNPIFAATQEDAFNSTTLNIGLPLLAPSAWYLYSMRKKNEKIQNLNLELTRQLISMKVTALYFTLLGLERQNQHLDHQIKASKSLNQELTQLHKEGIIPKWQKTQSQSYLLNTRKRKKEIQNLIQETKSELLLEMGYSPLDTIQLEPSYPFKAKDDPLQDLIYQALLNHPALHIQDKVIDLQKDNIKVALTNFLPNIVGYSNLNHSTDSFAKYSSYWITGIQGVWSIFNGFKNINEYKIAKAKEKQEYIKREEACLSTMLTVTKAYITYQNARENLIVAKLNQKAAEEKLNQYKHQWQEGLQSLTHYHQVMAEHDQAKTVKTQAEIIEQVSLANLQTVLGKAYMGKGK